MNKTQTRSNKQFQIQFFLVSRKGLATRLRLSAQTIIWPHARNQSGNAFVRCKSARSAKKNRCVLARNLAKLCLNVVNVHIFLIMDESGFKEKYQKYKLRVKLWEKDFKKKHNRVPSKVIQFGE